MANKVDKTVDLLRLLRGAGSLGGGLSIATVTTIAPVTLVIEGTPIPVDIELFEIPAAFIPLRVGDKFFTLPITSSSLGQRWGLLVRLNR